MLDDRRDVRKDHVRRRRSRYYEVDVIGRDTCILHRRRCRLTTHVRGRLVGFDDVAALDAGSGTDPLIRRVDDLLEVEVRHHSLGQIASRADDA